MPRVWDSGTDWLTLTLAPDDLKYSEKFARIQRVQEEMRSDGHELKRQAWLGYSGYAIAGLYAGEREDGCVIRASGREAGLVEAIFRTEGWDARCTRLDLQATAKTGLKEADYLARVQEALSGNGAEESKKIPSTVAAYRVRGASSGVTIGARSSERYHRIYDKTAEQRGRVRKGLVRFETEFKGQQARLMWKMLRSSASGRWLALSVVKTTFEGYGLDMDWLTQTKPLALPSSCNKTNAEKQLLWLQRNVRLTVKKLVAQGMRDEVLKALDLAE